MLEHDVSYLLIYKRAGPITCAYMPRDLTNASCIENHRLCTIYFIINVEIYILFYTLKLVIVLP